MSMRTRLALRNLRVLVKKNSFPLLDRDFLIIVRICQLELKVHGRLCVSGRGCALC